MSEKLYANDQLPVQSSPSRILEDHESLRKMACYPHPSRASGRGAVVARYLRGICTPTPKANQDEDSDNAAMVVVEVMLGSQIGYTGIAMISWREVNDVDSENKLLSLVDGKIAQAEAQAFRVRSAYIEAAFRVRSAYIEARRSPTPA